MKALTRDEKRALEAFSDRLLVIHELAHAARLPMWSSKDVTGPGETEVWAAGVTTETAPHAVAVARELLAAAERLREQLPQVEAIVAAGVAASEPEAERGQQ